MEIVTLHLSVKIQHRKVFVESQTVINVMKILILNISVRIQP